MSYKEALRKRIEDKCEQLENELSTEDRIRNLMGQTPFLFIYKNIIIPSDFGGWLEHEEVEKLIDGLTEYINFFTDEEIAEARRIVEEKHKEKYESYRREKPKPKKYGYIYLFKCKDKYKIDYSKNVERRFKELDNRPFELEYITKIYSENAYDIEKEMHNRLKEKVIDGEWYTNISINEFTNLVYSIASEKDINVEY